MAHRIIIAEAWIWLCPNPYRNPAAKCDSTGRPQRPSALQELTKENIGFRTVAGLSWLPDVDIKSTTPWWTRCHAFSAFRRPPACYSQIRSGKIIRTGGSHAEGILGTLCRCACGGVAGRYA